MDQKNVGRPPGTPKTGGRVAGTPNKRAAQLAELLEQLDCDPIEGMVLIAEGRLPCGQCAGKGKQKYVIREDELVYDPRGTLFTCLDCRGTGFEMVDLSLRLRAYAELAQYLHPKRKAIEVKPPDYSRGRYTMEEIMAAYRGMDGEN